MFRKLALFASVTVLMSLAALTSHPVTTASAWTGCPAGTVEKGTVAHVDKQTISTAQGGKGIAEAWLFVHSCQGNGAWYEEYGFQGDAKDGNNNPLTVASIQLQVQNVWVCGSNKRNQTSPVYSNTSGVFIGPTGFWNYGASCRPQASFQAAFSGGNLVGSIGLPDNDFWPLSAAPAQGIQVFGDNFMHPDHTSVRPVGANRWDFAYNCSSNTGLFASGPYDLAAFQAMSRWHLNAVRIAMNQDCWLGKEGLPNGGLTAAQYQSDIHTAVTNAEAAGLYVILEPQVVAPPGFPSVYDTVEMIDSVYGPQFWQSVASSFLGDNKLIFDLYNEPNTTGCNDCSMTQAQLRDGEDVVDLPAPTGHGYGTIHTASLQGLINTIRATGNNQPIEVPSPKYDVYLLDWLSAIPSDSANQLIASVHPYGGPNICSWLCTNSQFNQYLNPILSAGHPVLFDEMGQLNSGCQDSFDVQVWNWANAYPNTMVGYLPWSWYPDANCGNPNVIADWAGATPTQPFGQDFYNTVNSIYGVKGE